MYGLEVIMCLLLTSTNTNTNIETLRTDLRIVMVLIFNDVWLIVISYRCGKAE